MEKIFLLVSLVTYILSLAFFKSMYFEACFEKEKRKINKTACHGSRKDFVAVLLMMLNMVSGVSFIILTSITFFHIFSQNSLFKMIAILISWFVLFVIMSWLIVIAIEDSKKRVKEITETHP